MIQSKEIWRRAMLSENSTIQQAISNLDEVAIKIVLVVNVMGELVGTISDGDIRRGLLRGLTLASPIENVIHKAPLVVSPELESQSVKQLMLVNRIQQIPVVNELRKVVGLHLWHDLSEAKNRSNQMVIMAGGEGTRLRPLTENCPKPLLRVGGKPMLEHIIERAKRDGIYHFVLAINYLGHMIEDYFGDGEFLKVKIEYLREDTPLGTAGALSLLGAIPESPILVSNGDVLTDIRYGELLDFHTRQDATGTMAVRAYEWQHPFGVVQTNGIDIAGFEEKPVARSQVNAGVYVLSPSALTILTKNTHCDMPSLFNELRARGRRVIAYPMHEPWLDVGCPSDLDEAQSRTDVSRE